MKTTRPDLSPGQHLENTRIALVRWKLIAPDEVVPGLHRWRCGTQACFGGHVMHMPEFAHLFNQTSYTPEILETAEYEKMDCFDVDGYLFDSYELFNPTGEQDPEGLTDHEVVTNRLEQNAKRLEEEIERMEKKS